MKKRILSILLVLTLFIGIIPLCDSSVQAKGATLSELEAKYPHGKYWNGGNADSYTSSPCNHHGNCTYSGSCGCNTFKGLAIQCMGFAYQLAYLVYGGNPYSDWNTNRNVSALNSLKAGDVVRYLNNGHSIFIIAVNGDTVTYADCNSDGHCKIRWNQTISKSTIKKTFSYVDSAPYEWDTGTTSTLTINYNANGAIIPNADITGYTYKVTDSAGLNMRAGAGTGYDVVKSLSVNTTFNVNVGDTKTADGYTWGKTTVGGTTGWVVISDYVSRIGTLRGSSYYLNSSLIYQSSSSSVYSQQMTYNETYADGLPGADDFGLTRDGYTFAGWSLSANGGTVITPGKSLKPEEIVPDLKNGSKTVTLYAIWEEKSNITLSFDANGGNGTMNSVSAVKGDSITIPESQFAKDGYSFIGWTVQRDDGLWYTDANTWVADSVIADRDATKKVCFAGDSITLNSSFVTVNGDHGYTLFAVWMDSRIQSIQISSIGKENVYYVGDTLDTGGIRLMASNTDGTFDILSEGFSCSPMTLSNEGTATITVTYGSLTATYDVQVTKAKTSQNNGTGKSDHVAYLLPSTSAGTLAEQGVWEGDSIQVLCKDGDYYLTFIPWNATSAAASNRVLLYLPTNIVTVSGTIPSAADYYSLNPTGQNNATVNSKAYVYHRTDGGENPVTVAGDAYTTMGPLAIGDRVRILFEMDGYYCVQTESYTGFVDKSAITIDKILCGIYVDEPTPDFCLIAEKDEDIDVSSLSVVGINSDGSVKTIADYEIDLPDTASAGIKYATIRCGEFSTFVRVKVIAPTIADIVLNSDSTLTGLSEQVTPDTLKAHYTNLGYDVTVTDKDGNDAEFVGTGSKVTVGSEVYEVVVKGDISGDGMIDIFDLSNLLGGVNGEYELEGVFKKACLIVNEEEPDIFDLTALLSHVNGDSVIVAKPIHLPNPHRLLMESVGISLKVGLYKRVLAVV